MPRKKRALPEPPGRRVSAARSSAEKGLIFDELQEAMAEGKLERFMKENIPGGEYAKKLTEMMMGMSGMPVPKEEQGAREELPGTKIPEDILRAAHEGDVRTLSDLLTRELERTTAGKGEKGPKKGALPESAEETNTSTAQTRKAEENQQSLMEKEIIDSLYEIAMDNGLSMDWIIHRALKLYIKKYRESGQL